MRHSPHFLREVIGRARSSCAHAALGRIQLKDRLDHEGGAVGLTFDDGPDPEYTPAVLDELRRLDLVATFFLVGHRARAHPEIVRRMIAEGHAVGSHSDSHPDPWTLPLSRLVREYCGGRARVEWAADRHVPLFRPPKGYIDARGALAILAARVRPWLWTVDPQDWMPDVSSADILAGVTELRGGDVVLLHDAIAGPLAPSALDRSATVAVLPALAALAAERGLHFTSLS